MYIGFWRRLGAYLIDYVILSFGIFLFFIVWAIIVGVFSNVWPVMGLNEDVLSTLIGVVGVLLLFSISWLYHALLESSKWGGTLGKRAVGAVVVGLDGDRPSFSRASARYWSKILSLLPFCLGMIMIGFTERKQGLHDILSRTYVISQEYEKTYTQPF